MKMIVTTREYTPIPDDSSPAETEIKTIVYEYNILFTTIEPYGEGKTDKEDAPCITIGFATENEATRFCKDHFALATPDLFEELGQPDIYFVHFWHIPPFITTSIQQTKLSL